MKEIRLFNTMFWTQNLSYGYEPKLIRWNLKSEDTELAVFTDNLVGKAKNYAEIKRKIAWLVESPVYSEFAYDYVSRHADEFDMVCTFRRSLIDHDPNKFKFFPYGTTWIPEKDRQIYAKSKHCSIVTSDKAHTLGQKFRQQVVMEFRGYKADVFGGADVPLAWDQKIVGLKDYMYSVACENVKEDYYFTEKLLDCFLTGTIPIYYGCPSIGNFFNTKGMVIVNRYEEIQAAIRELTDKDYNGKLEYIQENFERAKEYICPEDHVAKHILELR